MPDAPISAIAYAGAGHTRLAARNALVALLDPDQFGDFRDLRALYPDADPVWPAIPNAPLIGHVCNDDPTDLDWNGVSGVHTRLAVISEGLTPDAFLGGPGAEVTYDLAIDWMVVTTGTVEDWRTPTFEKVLTDLGLILHTAMRNPDPAFVDLSVGKVDLMQFDLGEHTVSSASIPVSLILDSETLLA